jgi:iron(III)-enterobactin esterase
MRVINKHMNALTRWLKSLAALALIPFTLYACGGNDGISSTDSLSTLDFSTTPPTRDARSPGYPAATELADSTLPPATANGNFIIGPTRVVAPELVPQASVAKGVTFTFQMRSADSKIYPGIKRVEDLFTAQPDPNNPSNLLLTTVPQPYTRTVNVYIPAGYVKDTEVPFIVSGDGALGLERILFPALDNLIAQKRIPPMVAIAIGNGGSDAQGSQRGLEYDTVSDKYTQFVETEVLPLVEQKYNIKLTKNPEGRATMGYSSSGAAAFTMAWFHPELYRRVLAFSITALHQQWPQNPESPRGAWEYHQTLIPNNPAKPIRVWLQVGDKDLYNPNPQIRDDLHDWTRASQNMAKALGNKGYTYQFLFTKNATHVDRAVLTQMMPAALEYTWQGYKAK